MNDLPLTVFALALLFVVPFGLAAWTLAFPWARRRSGAPASPFLLQNGLTLVGWAAGSGLLTVLLPSHWDSVFALPFLPWAIALGGCAGLGVSQAVFKVGADARRPYPRVSA